MTATPATSEDRSPRRPLVAGNWKMNLVLRDVVAYGARLRTELGDSAAAVDIALFPSFPWLPALLDATDGLELRVGAQDVHHQDQGAHTGDVSAPQLAALGCAMALCGHSERRAQHGETDELVNRKASAAQRHELVPVVCLGETLAQREAGETETVLARQLRGSLADVSVEPNRLVLAYEPVWAIGTGETATPEIAQEAHAFLRRELVSFVGDDAAGGVRILYGGSAKPTNCEALFAMADVDGFLVGGASLDPSSFLDMIRRCGS